MKIVVCPDSYKGSLKAKEIALIIASYIKRAFPHAEILEFPLADGGEGTAEIVRIEKFPNTINLKSHDPLGREIETCYYKDSTGEKAFIESAEIIGLPLLSPEEKNPLAASSYGLGEIIKASIESGAKEITVSLGGSATCDGGKGMLEALGDINDKNVSFTIICDVNNPLLGDNGAAKIFAPQKGAKEEDIPILEERLKRILQAGIKKNLCKDKDAYREGAGAAGGLGFAFQAFLNANTVSGIDFVLKETDFKNVIQDVDLIITGEGKIDKQSLMGKVLSGILKISQGRIPIIAIGGIIEDEEEILKEGVTELYQIADPSLTLVENMEKEVTIKNLKRTLDEMLKNNIFKQLNKNL